MPICLRLYNTILSECTFQYCLTQSFSRAHNPYDNAVMESFFGTLKKEELYRIRYRSERQIKECIESYIKFYNEERLHERLNYKTPDQIEAEYHSNFNGNQL